MHATSHGHGGHRRGISRSRLTVVVAAGIVSAAAGWSASVAASAGHAGAGITDTRDNSLQSASATYPDLGVGHRKHSPTPTPTPTSTPPTGGDVSICFVSDVHAGATGSQAAFAAYLKTLSCDRIAMPGDLTADGLTSQYTSFNGWYGAVKAKILPARGNHDARSPLSNYTSYWGSRVTTGGQPWYSVNLGAWHIVSLDVAGSSASTAERDWLRNDLAANAGRPTLAFWHVPRYSTGYHGDDAASESLWQTLSAYGADVVVNGHSHVAQRFTVTRGIREWIDSSAGYSLHSGSATSSITRAWIVPGPRFGVLRLVLHANSYDWTFTNTAGQALDHGTATAS